MKHGKGSMMMGRMVATQKAHGLIGIVGMTGTCLCMWCYTVLFRAHAGVGGGRFASACGGQPKTFIAIAEES